MNCRGGEGMKKIICLLLSIVLFISQKNIVQADVDYSQDEKIEVIETIINQNSFDDNNTYKIVDSYLLRSFVNDEELYTLYILKPYGYAIIYNETNSFMEGCYDKDAELVSLIQNGGICYYGGPGNYYVYESSKHTNLLTDVVIVEEDIQKIQQVETAVHNREKEKSAVLQSASGMARGTSITHVIEEAYFTGLEEYGTNVNGTCTVLATCILFGYYDEFINDSYVWDQHRYGDGTNEAFHQYLCNKVYGSSAQGGIFIRDALSGFNAYLAEHGRSERVYSEYSSQSAAAKKVMNRLLAGKPVVASMATVYGASYNHTVVVFGMIYDNATGLSTGTATFRVQTGWHGTRIMSASSSWFYECGYIM